MESRRYENEERKHRSIRIIVVLILLIIVFVVLSVTLLLFDRNPIGISGGGYYSLSPFGETKYRCVGSCYCEPCLDFEESIETAGKRRGIVASGVVKKVSSVIAAVTSYIAIQAARREFQDDCEVIIGNEGGCEEFSRIVAVVDSCEDETPWLESAKKVTEDGDLEKIKDTFLKDMELEVRYGFYSRQEIFERLCIDNFPEELDVLNEPENKPSYKKKTETVEIDGRKLQKSTFTMKSRDDDICTQWLDEMIRNQKESEKKWPEKTDCDRLDAAFEELNSIGILSIQNTPCCTTCGRDIIKDEISEDHIGFCFYHDQYQWKMVEESKVGLIFGHNFFSSSKKKDDEESMRIGGMIVKTLERHGLEVDWDGHYWDLIVKVDWKRRFDGECKTGWHFGFTLKEGVMD